MNSVKAYYWIIVFFVTGIGYGCKKDTNSQTVYTCDPATSYSARIRPVLVANCTSSGCHDGNNYPSLADYTVARDASIQIKDAVGRGIMPKYGTLSAADKAAIICWIDNGSKNN